mmetsp:Transcript_87817/g.283617  ORF Transcript_87817/g.283617 Transcript_87817/m.283617 type:complete len:239 (-) Transcript_87817:2-718(-)
MLLSASTSMTVPSILGRRFSRRTFNARSGLGQVTSRDPKIDHQLGFSLHRIPAVGHQLGFSFHRIPQHVLGLFQLGFSFLQGLGQLVGLHASTELGCHVLDELAPLRSCRFAVHPSPEEEIDEVCGIHHAVATCADRLQNLVGVLLSQVQLRQQVRHLSSPNPSAATHVHQHQKLQDRCAHVGCGSGIAGRGRGRRSRRSAGRHLHGRPAAFRGVQSPRKMHPTKTAHGPARRGGRDA